LTSGARNLLTKFHSNCCEMIEVNDTLEGLYHYGHFLQRQEDGNVYRPEYSVTPLVTALTKNTTLKIVDFHRLKCEDWEVAQVLKNNKLLVFASWDQRPGSRANKFNSVNQSIKNEEPIILNATSCRWHEVTCHVLCRLSCGS
jgi:hypothetical protein